MAVVKVRNIPTDRLKWLHRKTEREKLPKEYFLDPERRLYPYRNKDGSINCHMLRAARRLAILHGRKDIAEKALRLFKQYCGCCGGG
jgi:hypothetical protein